MEPQKFLPQFSLGLTFNDVLLLPGYSDFTRRDINLSAYLTRTIKLEIPFVSAPMDTVTESKLSIALGKLGGIGIIHRNLTVSDQVRIVKKVKSKKVLVGAATGSSPGFEERTKALVLSGVDLILIDSAHGFTKSIIDAVKFIKKTYPKMQVIAGNVATYEGTKALIHAGVDGLRVGMGPGTICTTRVISGMGVPQITAIQEAVRAARRSKIPIIADGGIVNSGDMVKALAAGADTIMMGGFFASAIESPGKKIKLLANQIPHRFKSILNHGKSFVFKEYRGMGSEGAMKKGTKVKSEDEFHGKDYRDRTLIAEGVEGLVPIKGTVNELVETAIGGIRSGLYYCGAKNISDLHKKARFIRITQQSFMENHPHDILVTNPGKSYA
ncbi:MAG: hypothetical protein A2868_04040 [Candidatus Levybacteria bacterium RIFCSPHIGHO2_01_FULL_40_15b]|nr:MAG: hypothetical protein A2868_04040 [Candidatus Levybacteria bacterium RIFCSPHIGHO2_01_FULL_40_15b]